MNKLECIQKPQTQRGSPTRQNIFGTSNQRKVTLFITVSLSATTTTTSYNRPKSKGNHPSVTLFLNASIYSPLRMCWWGVGETKGVLACEGRLQQGRGQRHGQMSLGNTSLLKSLKSLYPNHKRS